MSAFKQEVHWLSAARTHVGKVREFNEDALLNMPGRGVWAVADGMGGHHAGDHASANVIRALEEMPHGGSLSQLIDDCRTCLQQVNAELYRDGYKRTANIIGCTVVTMLNHETSGVVIWAGDSRAYLLRDRKLRRLTRDHSRVEELVQKGRLDPDKAEQHPQANVITRAVGVGDALELDTQLFDVQDDDTFLLCSDGLSRYLSDTQIAAILGGTDCEKICRALMDEVLRTSARDNVTVVVLRADLQETELRTQINPDGIDVDQTPLHDPTVLDSNR